MLVWPRLTLAFSSFAACCCMRRTFGVLHPRLQPRHDLPQLRPHYQRCYPHLSARPLLRAPVALRRSLPSLPALLIPRRQRHRARILLRRRKCQPNTRRLFWLISCHHFVWLSVCAPTSVFFIRLCFARRCSDCPRLSRRTFRTFFDGASRGPRRLFITTRAQSQRPCRAGSTVQVWQNLPRTALC